MNEEQFAKIFEYMQQFDTKLDAVRAELKSDMNRVYDLVDKQIKQQETNEQERLVMNRQLDRHETWIERAADELRVSYDPAG